jgi:hypothetical protein
MPIKKPYEILDSDLKIRMLIAGFPGSGKTTLALSAPDPLIIDSDMGLTRVHASHRKDSIRMESYEQIKQDIAGDISDYKTVVIDTGGELLTLMKSYVMKYDSKNGRADGQLSIKGYGAVGAEFASFVHDIYYKYKKNLVVVFHAKEEQQGDDTVMRILIEGQTKNNIWQPMELGGFIEMRGNNRVLSLENNERHYGKATHGVPLTLPIPDLGHYDNGRWVETQKNDLLTKVFSQIQENIKSESEEYEAEKESYSDVMNYFTLTINSMTFETVVDVQEAIKSAKHSLTSASEIKALFKEKLKLLGIKWNAEEKKYVADNKLAS